MEDVIAADLGATKLTVATVDQNLTIRDQETINVREKDYPATIRILIERINRCAGSGARSVGISIAGLMDGDGNISQLHNGVWCTYPLLETLESNLALPFRLENDGNAAALAEWKHGAGTDVDELVVLALGTKVGTGVIHEGRLLRWSFNFSPQIGGIIQTPHGLNSATYAGELCGGHGLGVIAERLFGRHVEGRELAAMARSGDRRATDAFAELGEWIGLTVAGTINLFHPKRIVLNGGVTQTFDLWSSSAEANARKHQLPHPVTTEIVKGVFSHNASLLGAAIVGFGFDTDLAL